MEARQKMGMEQQDLMKKAGANPASGCLPMFIQIPIMTALYGIFIHAFEMRGAEFLWIRDLSRQDQLATFGFFPYELNLLPLIYMGITIVQQRINPPPQSDDPQQEMNRKMMMYMPIMMSVLFYRMPAGLVLYFATSAIFGALETWYIKKYLIKDDGTPGGPGKVTAVAVPAKAG
jgi:YidC/Oxa1 family membrane protein insertase